MASAPTGAKPELAQLKHADFAIALRDAFVGKTGKYRGVDLPASKGLSVSGNSADATLTVREGAVGANMQNAASAVEGWALALIAWSGVKRVTLDWEEPEGAGANAPHFQRFLYRVVRFAELLGPEVVQIARPDRLAALRITHPGVRPTINVAQGRDTAGILSPTKSEAELEKTFIRADSPARHRLMSHLKLSKLDRQFPVGVFDGEPKAGSEIFTARKSAVDLIGLDAHQALYLFELKADGNNSVGAVSEIFFYAMVMYDLLVGRIAFPRKKPSGRLSLTVEEVRSSRSIRALLFARDFHPLISAAMLEPLNAGARRLGWPVNFSTLGLGPFLNPEG